MKEMNLSGVNNTRSLAHKEEAEGAVAANCVGWQQRDGEDSEAAMYTCRSVIGRQESAGSRAADEGAAGEGAGTKQLKPKQQFFLN